jgi:hypothetical protein
MSKKIRRKNSIGTENNSDTKEQWVLRNIKFYIIYKSPHFVSGQSRFLEAPFVRMLRTFWTHIISELGGV